MNGDIIKSIDKLLASDVGDKGRLEHIKDSISQGKTLYNSDKNYLNSLLDDCKPNSIEEPTKVISEDEIPISLDELRKSQPKPTYEVKPTKYGVSYSNSG